MSSPKPLNIHLWNKIKEEAKKKYKVWPSAYASGWLTKEYKQRGGRFSSFTEQKSKTSRSSRKSTKSTQSPPLSRWYKEKWIDVCYLPKKIPCGRSTADKNTPYPYCRPSKKISKDTPKLAQQLKPSELKKLCQKKRKSPTSYSRPQRKKN
jgi:hypothetical protein